MKTYNQNGITIHLMNNHYDNIKGTIPNFFITRNDFLGNPFSHLSNTKAEFIVENREVAIEKYKEYFKERFKTDNKFKQEVINFISWIYHEKEVNLVCWCTPSSCHGEFLIQFIFAILKNKK